MAQRGQEATHRKKHQFPEKDKPMAGSVGQVICGDNPGVLVGGDSPVLPHASCISISNVASIDVGRHVEHPEALTL